MAARKIRVELTPAQVRGLLTAVAYLEAEVEQSDSADLRSNYRNADRAAVHLVQEARAQKVAL